MNKKEFGVAIMLTTIACTTYIKAAIPTPSWHVIDNEDKCDDDILVTSKDESDDESEALSALLLEIYKKQEQFERERYKTSHQARLRDIRRHQRALAKLTNNTNNWVQCTNPKCGKWHIVPPDIDINDLQKNESWTCFDNFWNLSEAFCDYPLQIFIGKEAEAIEEEIRKELQTKK